MRVLRWVGGVRGAPTVENARDGSRWSEVKEQHARAAILTGAGFAVSAVGAAGLIAGLVWGLRKPGPRADRDARARLMTLASGHSLGEVARVVIAAWPLLSRFGSR